MESEPLGNRIARFRDEQGLSQSGLARLMGTSQSAISQIESGERNPSFETIRQIAKALKVNPAHLVGADPPGLDNRDLAHFRLLNSLSEESRRELEAFAMYLRQKQDPDRNP